MKSFRTASRIPPTPLVRRMVAVLLLAAVAAAPALADGPRPLTGSGDGTPAPAPAPVHTHTWVKQSQKEWVPPEKQTVQVGVDAKGKPVYETKIVKPGYWRTVTIWRCNCGATKR